VTVINFIVNTLVSSLQTAIIRRRSVPASDVTEACIMLIIIKHGVPGWLVSMQTSVGSSIHFQSVLGPTLTGEVGTLY